MDPDRACRLCLVVPCYNEAGRLTPGPFLEFLGDCAGISFLFVDDGSTDDTAAVLAGLASKGYGRIDVLTLPRNSGKAVAVRDGIVMAMGRNPELVGYWDADLSTPLSEVPAFLDFIDRHPTIDIVIGSRLKLMGRDIQRSAARHYLGRVFATAASMALGLAVYDTQCGAKIFRVTEAVAALFQAPFRSSWVFDVEILARYVALVGRQQAEASIHELPLMVWHDVPGSKVRARDAFRAALDLARMRGWTRRPGAWR